MAQKIVQARALQRPPARLPRSGPPGHARETRSNPRSAVVLVPQQAFLPTRSTSKETTTTKSSGSSSASGPVASRKRRACGDDVCSNCAHPQWKRTCLERGGTRQDAAAEAQERAEPQEETPPPPAGRWASRTLRLTKRRLTEQQLPCGIGVA